jgi:hypothetical protein
MASQKSQNNKPNNRSQEFSALYADVTLTAADKVAFLSWMSSVSGDFGLGLQSMLDQSYRVTFKTDYHNSCEQVTFTQQDEKHHNQGLIIISRSDSAEEAFWITVYKTEVLFEGQRLPTREDQAGWG